MDHAFMTEIHIVDVRHLHNIKIPLSRTERKHLILTGKNGSGKTSVLKSLTVFLRDLLESDDFQLDDSKIRIAELKDKLRTRDNPDRRMIHLQIKNLEANARRRWNDGCAVTVNSPLYMRERFKKGQFILAYYRDNRQLDLGVGVDYSKVELKSVYGLDEHPAGNIGKYLLNMKMTQGLAKLKMDEASGTERLELQQRMQDIDSWFNRFTDVLRDIYEEPTLKLDFDIDTHQFRIIIPNRDPFTLDCMSMGWTVIEALRISDGAKGEWNKHLDKLVENYNYFGAYCLYLLTYVDADAAGFQRIWNGYQHHIPQYSPGHHTYMDGSFVELNDADSPRYIKTAKCQYSCGGDQITVYHIFARIPTQNE